MSRQVSKLCVMCGRRILPARPHPRSGARDPDWTHSPECPSLLTHSCIVSPYPTSSRPSATPGPPQLFLLRYLSPSYRPSVTDPYPTLTSPVKDTPRGYLLVDSTRVVHSWTTLESRLFPDYDPETDPKPLDGGGGFRNRGSPPRTRAR